MSLHPVHEPAHRAMREMASLAAESDAETLALELTARLAAVASTMALAFGPGWAIEALTGAAGILAEDVN